MKKAIIILTLFVLAFYSPKVEAQTKNDTVFVFNGRSVNIQDSVGQIRINVYDKDLTGYKKVYEAIYSDSTTYEKYNVIQKLKFELPFFTLNKRKALTPHWSGFSFGKLTTADDQWNIGYTGGTPLDKSKSSEITFNILEGIVPVIGKTIGITSGFGLDWRNYHFNKNTHLIDVDGVTTSVISTDREYSYSRLRTLHLTIPVQLEWQPQFGKNKDFFVTAGIVGGWNVMSTYRIKYTNSDGDKSNKVESRGLNTNPLTLDFMGQIGYDMISVYAKYSPVGVFQKDKGPDINAASLGLLLHF